MRSRSPRHPHQFLFPCFANSFHTDHPRLYAFVPSPSNYVSVIGDLCRSEGCFGRLRSDETFEVVPIDLSQGQKGPVLRLSDLVSMDPIDGGANPPDEYRVNYQAAEREARG